MRVQRIRSGLAGGDENEYSVSVPLVEGTPVSSGSIATASRSARAKALKAASIMWWALEPLATLRCKVSLAFVATARKNSSVSSDSKPAIVAGGRSASNTHSGRPEMSIAQSASASSIGIIAGP